MISLAQQGSKISLSISPSRLIKLGNRNTFTTPKSPKVINASYSFASRASSEWQSYWHYPQISMHTFFLEMDNRRELGHVVGVLPSLQYKVIGRDRLGIYATFGTGLSYATRTYDKISNPTNNAIGSHLNNISHFGIDFRVKHHNFSGSLGYQLTHISNARTATPNTGYNLHGWQLTVSRHVTDKPRFSTPNRVKDTLQRWGGDILIGYGVSEYSFTGGDKYASYWTAAGLKYSLSKYISTTIGAEYEYNESIYQFHNQDFDPEQIAIKKATQTSVFLAQRLRFGYVAVRLHGGFYLPFPEAERVRHPNYLRVGVDIHPLNGHYSLDPYIGISLKSHKAVAQYLGMYSGVLF